MGYASFIASNPERSPRRRPMEERREIHRWQDVPNPVTWTFEDEHGHEVFRRGETESPQEMEEAGYLELRTDAFVDEVWIAEEHAECGGRQVYAVRSA
jgi:hypothetical protein